MEIQNLLTKLGLSHYHHDIGLLTIALTHKTYAMDFKNPKPHQERLEFLGDAILGASIATKLYQEFPDHSESQLTIAKIHLVREEMLAKVARTMNLGDYLLLGSGEARSGGANKDVILADGLESLIGYLYLQCGRQVAYDFVIQWIWPEFPGFEEQGVKKSYKNLVQEWVQREYKELPVYVDTEEVVEKSGNVTSFRTQLYIQGILVATASAQNKKKAQEEAARIAYLQLRN